MGMRKKYVGGERAAALLHEFMTERTKTTPGVENN
jgi:hypothetical protein